MSFFPLTLDSVNYVLYTSDKTATVATNTGITCPPNLIIPNTVYDGSEIYTVTSIQANAFTNSTVLTSINLPTNSQFTVIGNGAFQNTKLSQVTIPDSVERLGSSCFYSCTLLTSVNISGKNSSLDTIGASCFSFCSALTSINIPSRLTNINANAFKSCSTLSKVYFYGATIPIQSYNDQFVGIEIPATAYYVAGTDITTLQNRGWFTYYTVFDPTPCFKEDTLILTNKGYRRIQELRKGDLVKTLLNGFLKIDMIGKRNIDHKACVEDRIKDQLYKCSHENFEEVFEPLVLTGCHSILVDNYVSEEQRKKTIEVNKDAYVTDRKYRLPACVDERTTVYEIPGTYTIYHLALENPDYYMNYGIYANGLLVETSSKRYLKELSGMELIE